MCLNSCFKYSNLPGFKRDKPFSTKLLDSFTARTLINKKEVSHIGYSNKM